MKRKKLIKSPILEYRYENLIEILQMTVSNYRQDSHYYHYHNCWEVIIIQQGTLKYLAGNLPKEASQNDILVFGQNLPHGIIDFSKDIKGVILHISLGILPLNLDGMDASAKDCQFMADLNFGYLFRSATLTSRAMTICKRMKRANGFLKLSFLFQLLHHLAEQPVYEMLRTEQNSSKTNASSSETPVDRTFRFLYAHYHENLTLDMIADYAHQNASALCRSFKQVSGCTLFQFINRLRIEKACSLLRNTSLNVTQIAYQVGFSSLAHFHVQFKKYTGTIPSEYKNICH